MERERELRMRGLNTGNEPMAFCFEFPSLFSFLFMLLDKSHCLCLCQAQGEPKLVHFEGFSL